MADNVQRLIFDILAKDNASSAFIRAGKSANDAAGDVSDLTKKLVEVSKMSVQARVGLKGNKEAGAQVDSLQLKLIKLGEKVADPNIQVKGALEAERQINAVERALDRLDKKSDSILIKASKSGALKPSPGIASILGLGPAAIPALAGVASAGALSTVTFGAALAGLTAFGLLTKQAYSQASTAAQAVEAAQNNYNASIAHGTKQAVAYRQEQKAIALAYAQMSPQQIALSKQVDKFSNSWQDVQKSITPVVSGALTPWLGALTKAMGVIKPLITPIAAVFQAWGEQLDRYFSSSKGSKTLHDIAVALGQFAAIQLNDVITFIKDLGTGIFNLGKDIGASHVMYGQFGGDLAKWGDAFASWSKSQQARHDVQAFVQYVRDNGRLFLSILADVARYIPGIFAGATAAGGLELKTLASFLGLVAKLPPTWAKPITELVGAYLLLAKTGVIKVGLQIASKAGDAWKVLQALAKGDFKGAMNVFGGAGDAAATIRAAMVSGGEAAAAEIRAAMTGGAATGGATAAGEEAAAGAGFGTKAGGGILGLAGPIGLGIAGGILANQALDSLLPKSVNNARTPFTIPGIVSNLTHGGTWSLPGGRAPHGGATNPLLSRFGPLGMGSDWLKQAGLVQDGSKKMTAAMQAVMSQETKLQENFKAQGQSAAAAGKDLGNYTTAIKDNGVSSARAQAARSQLIADLEGAGVKSKTANTDVSSYTDAVKKNGVDSSQAQAARARLIKDIFDAGSNATRGQKDLATYTTAVKDNGAKSDQARDARARLISDLIHSGVDARTARNLVDSLTTAISRLHSKDVKILMTGSGKYNIYAANTPVGAGGHPAHAVHITGAAGAYVGVGSTPTADDVFARVSKGELIVPARMVSSGLVDHLRGSIPGFASGGAVGNLTPGYVTGMYGAFQKDMTSAMVSAMRAAIRSALAVGMPGAHGGIGGGVKRWAPLVLQVLGMLGQPAGDLGTVLAQMTTESGGYQYAINLTDSNAAAGDPSRGLMQVIGSTFGAYAGPFRTRSIYDPEANIYAGLNYAIHRYGAAWTDVLGHGHGYDHGGWLMPGATLAYNNTGQPERVLPPGHGGGALVNVQQMTVLDATDARVMASKLDFMIRASSAG